MDYVQQMRSAIGQKPLILIAAGILITDAEDNLLLQRRSDNGQWGIPGGSMELGETVEETARRETLEETGLRVNKMELFDVFSGAAFRYSYPNGDAVEIVSVVFIAQDFEGQLRADSAETLELRFFSREDLATVELTPANRPVVQRFL